MKLFFTDGNKKGDKNELSPPGISIGRELDNDVILELEGASRYHAKIEWKDSEWYLKDLGSTNGTKLNGEKITANESTKLKEGDKIRIGKQTMLFAEEYDESKVEDIAPVIKEPDPVDDSKPADPSSVTISEEKPKADDDKSESGMDDSQSFLKFFDEKEDGQPEDKKEDDLDFFGKKEDKKSDKTEKGKKHAGLLFYVAVIGAAIILIAGFLIIEQSKGKNSNRPTSQPNKIKKGAPLLIRYEKQVTTSSPNHNIFRFVLEINNGKVTITRDDLQAGLKDQPSRKIGPEKLSELEEDLRATDFMSAEQEQAGIPRKGEDKRQNLTIAYGKDFNSITVSNTSPPRAFEEAVTVLENFSDTVLNVPAISLTPEELREEGMDAFRKGKLLFENYRAEHENLYQAKKLLKIAIENLGSFQPEPPEYNAAYKMREEAARILQSQIHAHGRNAEKYYRLGQFQEAKEEFKLIMEKTEPGSKPYNTSRGKIIKLEELIRRTKK